MAEMLMSAKVFYIRVEGVNFDGFVLDTNDISTIRGGSLALLNAINWIENRLKSNKRKIEVVVKGASMGVFNTCTGDKAEAEKIKAKIEKYLRKNGILKHATFVVDMEEGAADGKGFRTTFETLMAKNRWGQMQSLSVVLPQVMSQPAKQVCVIDKVRPAHHKAPEHISKDGCISISTEVRRNYGVNQRNKFYKSRAGVAAEDMKFTDNLEELAKYPAAGNLNNKMAVIYLDGNKFGRIRGKIDDSADSFAQFDGSLRGLQNGVLAELLIQMKKQKGWKTEDNKYRLETLMWGGDEIMWVVPAWKGWEALTLFFEKSKDWKYEEPLTHSAGVVFCGHKSPIFRVKKLAKKLADIAKETNKTAITSATPDGYNYKNKALLLIEWVKSGVWDG
jgi:hypothetical protein